MSYTIIIPARLASTRLPEKPLADIMGKPLIQHVWQRANESQAKRVIIATDHQCIADACRAFDAETVLTSAKHPSGTDRLQEVCEKLGFADEDIILNLQGDEPLFPAQQLDQLHQNLVANQEAAIATLCCPVQNQAQLFNPNVVKLLRDTRDFALYFSRAPIPFIRDAINVEQHKDQHVFTPSASDTKTFEAENHLSTVAYRHLGVYAYRAKTLHQFVQWPTGTLEALEKLEQLRVLENGGKIHCALASHEIPEGVDTPEDLEQVRAYFSQASSHQS